MARDSAHQLAAVTATPSRRRAIFGGLDQAFSSTSNGVTVFAVAVVASPEAFGHISILISGLVAVVGCLRGCLGIPLLQLANKSTSDVRREGSLALAAVLVVSPLVIVAMLCFTPQVGFAAVALAVSVPLVLGQDVLRHVAMAIGRPQVAALWDGFWCGGAVIVLVCAWLRLSIMTAGSVLASWALLALIAFVVMSVDMRVNPSFTGFTKWIRSDWPHRARYAVDVGLDPVGILLVLTVVTVIVSVDATGALRGAIALFTPFGVLYAAIQLVLIPESVRASASPQQVWRILARTAVLTAFGLCVCGLVFYLLPPSIGFYLLGETFEPARSAVPATTAWFATGALSAVLSIYLRTLNRSAAALRLKITYAVAQFSAALFSALWIGSAAGVATGLAVAQIAVALAALFWLSPWKREVPTPDTSTPDSRRQQTVLPDRRTESPAAPIVLPYGSLGVVSRRPIIGIAATTILLAGLSIAVRSFLARRDKSATGRDRRGLKTM